MTRTKKPTVVAADLPIEAVTTAPAKPKRASRSKEALAARAVAEAYASNDWSKVSDAQIALAQTADTRDAARALVNNPDVVAHAVVELGNAVTGPGNYDGMTAFQAERELAQIDADLAEVDALLDEEIEKSVAALDDTNGDGNEIVRSLSSVSLTDDPLAEEAAAARLERYIGKQQFTNLVDGIPYEFGTMIELPPGANIGFLPVHDHFHLRFTHDGELQLTPCTMESSAAFSKLGDTLLMVGNIEGRFGYQLSKEQADGLLEFLDMNIGDDTASDHEDAKLRLLTAQAKKLELDNAEREPPQAAIDDLASVSEIALDTYDVAVEQYAQILELEGKLATLETARTLALTTAKESAADADEKRGIIRRQDARIEQLEGYLKTTQDLLDAEIRHTLRLDTALKSFRNRGLFARILNRAPVLPLSAPTEVNGRRNSRSTTSEVNFTIGGHTTKATMPPEAADQLRRQGTRVIR